ncbi:hypothetical protein ACWDOP_32065 [Nocardia sp. NPDC003693]
MPVTTFDTGAPPAWVRSRSVQWNRMTANGIAQENLSGVTVTSGTTHNISVRSGADAAFRLTRIHNAQNLVLGSPDNPVKASPVGDPITTTPPKPAPQATTPEPATTMPPPNKAPEAPPAPPVVVPEEQHDEEHRPAKQHLPGVDPNPPRTVPQQPNSGGQNPVITKDPNPVVDPSVPPVWTPPPAVLPGADPFGLPDTTGRLPGDEWLTQLPNGTIVVNRIPLGNGNQTVDQEIPDGKGGTTYSRVVAVASGWRRWNTHTSGHSFYGEKTGPDEAMYGQHFNPGTSTFGAPDWEFGASPDYRVVDTPSFDANGVRIGTDRGIQNRYGLYDNIHRDLYGNEIWSQARPDGKGGVNSTFAAVIDSSGRGWVLRNGRPAERFLDGNGKEVVISRDPLTGKQTVEFEGGKNTLDAEGNLIGHRAYGADGSLLSGWTRENGFVTTIKPGPTGLEYTFYDQKTGREGRILHGAKDYQLVFSDGEIAKFDLNGNMLSHRPRPDTRSFLERVDEYDRAFREGQLKAVWGAVTGITALLGANDQINTGLDLVGIDEKYRLISGGDAAWGLVKGFADLHTTAWTSAITVARELTGVLVGNQGFGAAWVDIRRDMGAMLNAHSKFLIGVDWEGASHNLAETLGQASVGGALLLAPTKGVGSVGRVTKGTGNISRGAQGTGRAMSSADAVRNTGSTVRIQRPNLESRPTEGKPETVGRSERDRGVLPTGSTRTKSRSPAAGTAERDRGAWQPRQGSPSTKPSPIRTAIDAKIEWLDRVIQRNSQWRTAAEGVPDGWMNGKMHKPSQSGPGRLDSGLDGVKRWISGNFAFAAKNIPAPGRGSGRSLTDNILEGHRALGPTVSRVTGLTGWAKDRMTRSGQRARDMLNELFEARRQLEQDPALRAQVDLDAKATAKAKLKEGELMPTEFDFGIHLSDGTWLRTVEVKTLSTPVQAASSFALHLNNATAKVADPSRSTKPIMSPHLSIFARIETGIFPARGLNLERKANGDIVQKRSDGGLLSDGRPSRTTNIFDDFKDRLNGETGPEPKSHGGARGASAEGAVDGAPKKIENLDRISIIDERTHALIAEFNRINNVWIVTKYGK